MSQAEPTVFVVDDDAAILKSLRLLLKSVKINVEVYLTAQEFLDCYDPDRLGCLVLDLRMPDMSGLQLQEKLREKNIGIPVIIVTGHGDVPVAVQAMKKGAMDFVEKPFSDEFLLERIKAAIEKDAQTRQEQAAHQSAAARLSSLTPRESQVMNLVTAGKLNKVIAAELGISQKTVEFHRAQIMKKAEVDSVAELVKLVMQAENR